MRSSRANEILHDKPAGTFLIRKRAIDSEVSTDAEIAISFVDYETYEKHNRKTKEPEKGKSACSTYHKFFRFL